MQRLEKAESARLMIRGHIQKQAYFFLAALMAAVLVALMPRVAVAQDAAEATAAETTVDGAEAADAAVTETAGSYTPMAPTEGKGMPVQGGITFQDQFSANGDYALWMHNSILLPVITIISLFVLGLLLWVVARYRRGANPTPSKTTHNTLIEVVWTLVPVLILVGIAVPSISLLAKQYETPPEDAVTVKAIGYQWYWGYEYPDNGGFEIISNMLDEADALASGEPPQLAVDNRLVLPANTPIRLQTTAADVIHSFAVPSLWFKLDAVPGRLNEKMLVIDEPGVYYGQCSELCGARHGYMPIAVEALPRDQWEAWVRQQPGGTVGGDEGSDQPAFEPAELEVPDSVLPDAPTAGPPPTEDTSPTT